MTKIISNNIGFRPISTKNAKFLILGSIPSIKLLKEQQYYTHHRNIFWDIMAIIFNFDVKPDYLVRCEQQKRHNIAV